MASSTKVCSSGNIIIIIFQRVQKIVQHKNTRFPIQKKYVPLQIIKISKLFRSLVSSTSKDNSELVDCWKCWVCVYEVVFFPPFLWPQSYQQLTLYLIFFCKITRHTKVLFYSYKKIKTLMRFTHLGLYIILSLKLVF